MLNPILLSCKCQFPFGQVLVKRTLKVQGCNVTRQDMIGPPNPVSNLRPIKYYKPDNETYQEENLRKRREALHKWNEDFWTKHNAIFLQEREAFKRSVATSPNADEMSVFYKQFLDKNWKIHLNYNLSWYKQNIQVTSLHLYVAVRRLVASVLQRVPVKGKR